jgi:ribonuclease BN (tRNA processing enzyme)
MTKATLTCLGVGDGRPCADRRHAAFLYRFGKTSLLVDCGEPVADSLRAKRLDCDTVDGIFISHLHADHVGGFFMLLQGLPAGRRHQTAARNVAGRAAVR